MRFSPDPHIAAIQRNCVNSRRAWMSHARWMWTIPRGWMDWKRRCRDAVVMARRASRSAWQIGKGS